MMIELEHITGHIALFQEKSFHENRQEEDLQKRRHRW